MVNVGELGRLDSVLVDLWLSALAIVVIFRTVRFLLSRMLGAGSTEQTLVEVEGQMAELMGSPETLALASTARLQTEAAFMHSAFAADAFSGQHYRQWLTRLRMIECELHRRYTEGEN